MLKRQFIRQTAITVLSDPGTPVTTAGEIGLTLAGDNIFDTHLDPLQLLDCGCDRRALPAIAVYSESETLNTSDPYKYDELCFDQCNLSLVLELYACAAKGYELEAILDQLEQQVRIKLLPDTRFYQLAHLRGYRSTPRRAGDGKRLGMRVVELTLAYHETVSVLSSENNLVSRLDVEPQFASGNSLVCNQGD